MDPQRHAHHPAPAGTTGQAAGHPPGDAAAQPLPAPTASVLYRHATEPPHSSPLNAEWRAGHYLCAGCHQPLFCASAKYDSGSGWPSFHTAIAGAVATRLDFRRWWPRTEYHCTQCGGHQGHVFRDGPPPAGLRYCNNGVALRFVPAGEALPPLRQGASMLPRARG